jgi:hypothetical protein
MNKSSYFPLRMLCPSAPLGVMFGPTEFKETCWLYPDRRLKLNSTIIWVPEKRVHIGIASYVDAQKNGDEAALAKLRELGIPLGVRFSGDNDFSDTYEVIDKDKPRRGRKPGSGPVVKVMRAQFPASFEDGTKFKAGDVVKIAFRRKFVKDDGGAKKFQNAYERPTEEELKEFLAEEAKTR